MDRAVVQKGERPFALIAEVHLEDRRFIRTP
jgi:hypothetical protein